MKAIEIYNCVKAKYPDLETTICCLHKSCINSPCQKASAMNVLDFDCVERRFHDGAKPSPSVDAVAYNDGNTIFYFVEIKGWSKWKDLCNKYLSKRLDDVPDVKKLYVYCKDFDKLMEKV